MACFEISASDDTSQDEQLKADINAIRTSLGRSGFKTRFAAVLVSDQSVLQAPGLEERLSSIRRLTSLDSKTGLFFMPPLSSQTEIASFVQSLMTTLQPLCIEYYRDLTKHARRKKTRGGPPASVVSPVGSQSLSTPGWNVRYEVKQGVFAEFRQEMDVAERQYSAAIDELFNAEGVLEATPSWSPRWDEARLLCDSLAMRVLRCQLWSSQTTGAAESWSNYRARMKDLVDRRGKGSQTYGWEAWEARWAEVMAQLIQRADLPAWRKPLTAADESTELGQNQVYAMPEKTFAAAERIPPLHSLHHSGYWLKLAVRGSRARRKRAIAIPEEDRVPPGQSPASTVASRVRNYDCYLALDPHEEASFPGSSGHDHLADIRRLTDESTDQFQDRGQGRMTELMKLDLAHDHADSRRFGDAMEVLVPLWEQATWREEQWQDIFAELLLLLHQCAERQADAEVLLASTYELLSIQAPLPAEMVLDLNHCLDKMKSPATGKVSLSYEDQARLCPVAVSFAFESKETHVGESLDCQLTLTSCTNTLSKPLVLSRVTIQVGPSKAVKIVHSPNATEAEEELVDLSQVAEGTDGSFEAEANLTFRAAQRRVFNLKLTFRDPEIFHLKQAVIFISAGKFNIEHKLTDEVLLRSDSIFVRTENALERRLLPHAETTAVAVLPKPPKVRILLHGLKKQYYNDQTVRLSVEIINEEAEAIDWKISAQQGPEAEVSLPLQWTEEGDGAEVSAETQHDPAMSVVTSISQLDAAALHKARLLIKAPSEPSKTTITIEMKYALWTDKTTPLSKTLTLELDFTTPFEARFSLAPLLYQGAWPSYFDPDIGHSNDQAGGIPQLWRLSSQMRSLAADNITFHKVEVVVDDVIGDSHASVHGREAPQKQPVKPDEMVRSVFEVLTTKYSLDDRRPTTVESMLVVVWSQDNDSDPITTHIPVPHLTLPTSEPRVFCTLAEKGSPAGDATLHYHIENPSTHFLTFALEVEASEDFAFRGPKYRTLSLAPLSRHRVEYWIAVHDRDDRTHADGYWIWPELKVTDSYYRKTLRVYPGGDGVKFDDKQNIAVWIEGL